MCLSLRNDFWHSATKHLTNLFLLCSNNTRITPRKLPSLKSVNIKGLTDISAKANTAVNTVQRFLALGIQSSDSRGVQQLHEVGTARRWLVLFFLINAVFTYESKSI